MEDNRYFLGLDGGGTKTHCALYDRKENRIDLLAGGASNYEALPEGMSELPGVLSGFLGTLLSRNSLTVSDLSGAAFGMGGVDTEIQHSMISEIITGLGIRNFTLANDSTLGIKAECPDGWGISAVNGTGYSVTGISPRGEKLQIGGHGDLTGDKGGGSYLVPAVIRRVYGSLFKGGEKTVMAELLYDLLHIGPKDDLCSALFIAIMNDQTDSYNKISRILYHAAAEGDGAALAILEECGNDYALSIKCVAEKLELPYPVPVVLVGSQFIKCECRHAIDVLEKKLNPEEPKKRFLLKPISVLPVAGAVLWALETAGIHTDEKMRVDIRSRLDGSQFN